MQLLETDDNQLPWVKYYTSEYTWYGTAIMKKEYLQVVKFEKGVCYIVAEQYWRLLAYLTLAKYAPYGWWR